MKTCLIENNAAKLYSYLIFCCTNVVQPILRRQLIEQLVENLRNAATDALEAVRIFENGLIEQGKLIREKISNDVQKLKDKFSEAIQSVVDKITGSGAAVRECINVSLDNSLLCNVFCSNILETILNQVMAFCNC